MRTFSGAITHLCIAGLACARAVTSDVSIALGPLTYNSNTKTWSQTAAVTNSGKTALTGPLSLVLADLSSDATLTDGNGSTVCVAPAGSPYVNLGLTNNELTPGQSAQETLEFSASPTARISFKSEVAGAGAR